ncbi:hypothetical protein GJ496_010309 [Pomphorhynchus laevis]|nr:hypothetical protein GJ496_010309 [Pomphorhynchus laevis]
MKLKILRLYKEIIKEAKKFKHNNLSEYFVRHARYNFQETKLFESDQQLNDFIKKSEDHLRLLKRQAIISEIYNPNSKLF